MTTTLPWTATASEQIRLLAMLRLADGWSRQDVCDFLGISGRSISRWCKSLREVGPAGLLTRPRGGRPPKLTDEQAAVVLAWLARRSACDFGFATERWTAPRVAAVIEQRFGVRFNARYLNDWLGRRGVTPQMPQRQLRERDQAVIDAWVRHQWPRVKKRRATCTRRSVLPMKAASCWRR